MIRKSPAPKSAERECGSCEQVRPIRCSETRDGKSVDFCGECWEFMCQVRGGTAVVEERSLTQSSLNPCILSRLAS